MYHNHHLAAPALRGHLPWLTAREPRLRQRPLRILEFRSAEGAGGGPEKTILLGAARTDPERFAVTVCYIRDHRVPGFAIASRARQLGVEDYVEIPQRRLIDPAVWRAARRLQRERRFDIIHAHDYKTDLITLLLARTEKVIPLSTAHGWTGLTWREKYLYYAMDRRLLARFPLVIAVSNQIREHLIHSGVRPGRVRTVLNGIDHQAFWRDPGRQTAVRARLGLNADATVIGSVGRLEPIKRFDLLLQAFAVLRRRRPGLRLVIAGEGSERSSLERLARQLGLDLACRFLGHYADVAELHHAFDVFVQTSDYEGTPNVVLEAMALETPVVATEAGGTGEILHDGVHGCLIPKGDRDAIIHAVEHTLADREATRRRVAAARGRVERELSFTARMRTVEAVYEELAARFLR
jgi:glycosyltransferase involved in cell wall biosynthesis